MPKATAVWLIENTSLTFKQIAEFCNMHILEVHGIADDEVARGIAGIDPVTTGQLTREEIGRCEKDPDSILQMSSALIEVLAFEKRKKGRYTPIARRGDKPDAIAWLLKSHPELVDSQIIKLIGTTKHTIESVRYKTHWNYLNIKPKDPVLLGLCSQTDLNNMCESRV